MTRDELMRAFEMRIDGMSFEQIGQKMSYSKNAIRQNLVACMRGGRGQAYPELECLVMRDYDGNLARFARTCGIPYNALYVAMSGRSRLSKNMVTRICAATGLTSKDVLREKDTGLPPDEIRNAQVRRGKWLDMQEDDTTEGM